MKRYRCILLLFAVPFIWNCTVSAQSPPPRKYFYIDSCPDPLTNHIATRKIYEPEKDSTHPTYDTIVEYYDRQGRIISAEKHFLGQRSEYNPYEIHRFYYDDRSRIRCDTSFDDSLRVTTYTYSPNKAIIHYPPPYKYSDQLPVEIINYDDDGNMKSEFQVNHAGDTMISRYYDKNIYTEIWKERNDSGALITGDSTVNAFWPRESWRSAHFIYEGKPAYMLDVDFNNSAGQCVCHLFYIDSLLRDSSIYFYSDNRLCLEKTWIRAEWPIPVQNVSYTYNEKGQLLQKREWDGDTPEEFIVTNYIYNERGLRIEENVQYEHSDGQPNEWGSREIWEYTYY